MAVLPFRTLIPGRKFRQKNLPVPPKSKIDQGDPNDYGEIWVSDSKGTRRTGEGFRHQVWAQNRSLAHADEGGTTFTFRQITRSSEHHG